MRSAAKMKLPFRIDTITRSTGDDAAISRLSASTLLAMRSTL
jgi:hypothetical protein